MFQTCDRHVFTIYHMCACKLRKSIHNIINIFLYFYRLTNEETRKIWEESGDPDGPGGKICFMVRGERVTHTSCFMNKGRKSDKTLHE